MTPEQIFTALAMPEGLPHDAMIAAGERREEMIPVFLDLIHRLQRSNVDSVADDDLSSFLFAFFLLGEWREARAYRPLTALLRHDSEFLDVLLGDALADGTARVIVGVFDGDLMPILGIIEDEAADMFVRSQMIDALVLIARDCPHLASEVKAFMEWFDDAGFDKPDVLWENWAFAVAELGLAHLDPLVRQAFEDERIPPELSTVDHFQRALEDAVATGTSRWFHESRKTGPIESAVDELSGWYCFSDAASRDQMAIHNALGETFERETPKVGRNDPCPCGSGKKFKKCCLH